MTWTCLEPYIALLNSMNSWNIYTKSIHLKVWLYQKRSKWAKERCSDAAILGRVRRKFGNLCWIFGDAVVGHNWVLIYTRILKKAEKTTFLHFAHRSIEMFFYPTRYFTSVRFTPRVFYPTRYFTSVRYRNTLSNCQRCTRDLNCQYRDRFK